MSNARLVRGAPLLFRPNNLVVRSFADAAATPSAAKLGVAAARVAAARAALLEKKLEQAKKKDEELKVKVLEAKAKALAKKEAQKVKEEEKKLAVKAKKEMQKGKKELQELKLQEIKQKILESPENYVKAYASLKPRRLVSFTGFVKKNFAEYKKAGVEGAGAAPILKKLAEAFGQLSPEEKAAYAEDKDAYLKRVATWESWAPPTLPKGARAYFMKKHVAEGKQDDAGLAWKNLLPSDKTAFEKEFEEKKAAHVAALEQWSKEHKDTLEKIVYQILGQRKPKSA